MPKTINAIGAHSAQSDMTFMSIQRRDLKPTDVEMEILYCGICHSDLHQDTLLFASPNQCERKSLY